MSRNYRKNNNDDGIVIVFTVIIAMIIAFVEAIISIVKALIKFVEWSEQKINEKINVKNILKKPFKNVRLNYKNKDIITRQNILKDLNLFNMNTYNNIFLPQIRTRGEEYCNQNKIKNIKQNSNKYSCEVTGTEDYKVSILFNHKNNNLIENISCTCPYYIDEKKGCKHIYAFLYKIKCSNNKEIILEEIHNNVVAIETMMKRASKEFEINSRKYKSVPVSEFKEAEKINIKKIYEIEEKSKKSNKEEKIINYLIDLLNIKKDMVLQIKKVFKNKTKKKYWGTRETRKDNVVLTQYVNDNENNEEDIYENDYGYTKEQLEHLEPWQLELVKKGEYDPSGFEEEEPEDDDWHSDDEDETIK